jgi:WD40 repeat protein
LTTPSVAIDGSKFKAVMRHEEYVNGAVLTKDEGRILSWSGDKTLRLWDAASGQQIGPAMRHDDLVRGAVLTRDEGRILSWSHDNTLRLWDAATGPAMRHEGWVYGAVLTRDEGRILSWSADQTLRLWDAATGQQIAPVLLNHATGQPTSQQIGPAMRHEDAVNGAVLTKDEGRILSWSDDKTLRLWDAAWPSGTLFEIACALVPDRDLSSISERFHIVVSDPICDPNKRPAEPDWSKIERAHR